MDTKALKRRLDIFEKVLNGEKFREAAAEYGIGATRTRNLMTFVIELMRDPCRWQGEEQFTRYTINRFDIADLRKDKAFWLECVYNLRVEYDL